MICKDVGKGLCVYEGAGGGHIRNEQNGGKRGEELKTYELEINKAGIGVIDFLYPGGFGIGFEVAVTVRRERKQILSASRRQNRS